MTVPWQEELVSVVYDPTDPASEILDRPLEGICLSTRSRNALARLGVSRVSHLLALLQDEQALRGAWGLGEKSIAELRGIARHVLEHGSLDGLLAEPADAGDAASDGPASADPRVPPEILCAPLDSLALSTRCRNVLTRMGVHSIEQFLDLASTTRGFANLAGLGAGSTRELRGVARTLSEQGSLEGLAATTKRPPLLAIDLGPEGRPRLPDLLPEIARQALRESEMEVLKARFGLDGSPPTALQDIGFARGITRERIRQIECKGLQRLRSFLLGHASRQAHVPAAPERLVTEATETHALLERLVAPVAAEASLSQVLTDRYASPPRPCDLKLLLETFGFTPVAWPGAPAPRAWRSDACSREQVSDLWNAMRIIRACLAHAVHPVPTSELLAGVRQQKDGALDRGHVILALRLDHGVEALEDAWQLEFRLLPTLADKGYRVLYEAGHPMAHQELVQEINRRLGPLGEPPVSVRSVTSQLAGDPRFRAVGRSGIWGLASWDFHTDTIINTIVRFLHERGRGASVDDIVAHVVHCRPDASPRSVAAYLWGSPEFVRVEGRLFELAAWGAPSQARPKPARGSTSRSVRDALARIAASAGSHPLPRGRLVCELSEETGLCQATIYGLLEAMPGVTLAPDAEHAQRKLVRLDAALIATFDPDQERSKTRRVQVWEAVEEFLASCPGRRARLQDVVWHVSARTGCQKPTIYAYLSEMEGLQKVEEAREKYCFLAGDPPPLHALDPTLVSRIEDEDLRRQVERARRLLGPDDVEIGLRELCRVMEREMRRFLETARKVGSLALQASDLEGAEGMLDCVNRHSLVTPQQHRRLQVLRDLHDDLDHAGPRTDGDRERLAKHAALYADDLVGFVAVFHDKRRSLNDPQPVG